MTEPVRDVARSPFPLVPRPQRLVPPRGHPTVRAQAHVGHGVGSSCEPPSGDRYYVKEFEADTNLRCCLIVDTSGSMDFGSSGSRGVTKLDYARQIAGSLGYLAVQQGDAVGLACVAENIVRNLPPRRNPGHLRLVFDMLEKAEPQGGTRLVEALHELAETIRQRALVVVLSDLFVEPDAVRGCLEHLRFRKHDVAVFHLLDPLELAFTFHRPTRFVDMEGGASLFAEPSEIADRYQRALRAYLDGMRAVMLETAVDYHRVSIDEDYEPLLGRFLIGRARGRGGR